jgi:glutamate dehydrogenase
MAPAAVSVQLLVPQEGSDAIFRLQVGERPATLSAVVPLLERLGLEVLDETSERLVGEDNSIRFTHTIGVRHPEAERLTDSATRTLAEECFVEMWTGRLEADGFNRLVLTAGLTSKQIDVLRAYTRYQRQIGTPFTQAYVEDTLCQHPKTVRTLCALFAARFDPAHVGDRVGVMSQHEDAVRGRLDEIESIDEDRILRGVLELILATDRTNAYRPQDGRWGASVLSFKFDPAKVPDLPLPRPRHEIWVCAVHVEAVHLRGGDVARGGLRWSDRREDFRTEVLGLMKAQMVKNAVIVPVGAKGGFVVKCGAGVDAYKSFIGGMLDLTDNLIDGNVVPPPDVVRHDADDLYLVVAADKGTARFSDIANGVAADYNFWLGDGFASGGSHGYDHKVMGITAKGAWESVRRHGRSLGLDVDNDELTCIGIGDMSGDVFGNGLLRSPHALLIAAFDHRHIFLDPNPGAASSFAERQRLYDLPSSSWNSYRRELISPGGGVFPRSAKSIPLSAEVRERLNVSAMQMTPTDLISAILRAPVDLLWNGGIGTYVKAESEHNSEVGDKSNDSIRLNGSELRCRMVGEGGNLGFTQLGRVEYALGGGLINTDAIDNSAGVDCSDHEVNIKIALADAISHGLLAPSDRDDLLVSMQTDVGEAVLADNHDQNIALVLERANGKAMVDVHARTIRSWEAEAVIDRAIERLPTDKRLTERAVDGLGLVGPEFAVMLAYAKTTAVAELLESSLPDEPYLESFLTLYFPPAMRIALAPSIKRHRLRREIVTTVLVNEIVNMQGISFFRRMEEETGAELADIARAWLVTRDVLGLPRWWDAIDRLGSNVTAALQTDLFHELRRVAERSTMWMLRRHQPPLDVAKTVEKFTDGVDLLARDLDICAPGTLGRELHRIHAEYVALGVSDELADRSAIWGRLHSAFDIVDLATRYNRAVNDVARVYWGVFDRLDIGWLWDRVGQLPRQTRWSNQARSAVRDDLMDALRSLAEGVLRLGDALDAPEVLVLGWVRNDARAVARTTRLLADVRAEGLFDLASLIVAVHQLWFLAPGLISAGPLDRRLA